MVVTTGFFDGVHIGHRSVIDALVKAASERSDKSTVITFWPHPRTVLQNDARSLRLLSSLSEKKEKLLSLGVDRVEVLDFTKEFSRLTTQEYLSRYVIDRFGARSILLGYDNRIGNAAGSPEDIARIASGLGLEVLRVPAVQEGELTVSSSKIRAALAEGLIEAATSMLGSHYSLHGVVVSGNRLGRTIGFPTANMQLYEPLKLVPAAGAYAVEVETLGSRWRGMANIGVRPTVGLGLATTIETHIFDFDEEIYGLDIRISFVGRLRDEARFGSLEELRKQLETDKARCAQFWK